MQEEKPKIEVGDTPVSVTFFCKACRTLQAMYGNKLMPVESGEADVFRRLLGEVERRYQTFEKAAKSSVGFVPEMKK